jgi:phage tail-like protein
LVALADGDLLRIGEEGGFQTTLEVVDDVRRAARERNRQWWTHWAADTQEAGSPAEPSAMLPALTEGSVFLLQHLPELLRNGSHGFAPRFLALFDHVLLPLRWQAANFDLLLDPVSSPAAFLPWLAQWHRIAVDDSWTEPQRRQLLASAPYIFARHGTAAALHRVLEIYTGVVPLIRDGGDLPPRQFEVVLDPCGRSEAELRAVIDAHKPIHVDHYRIIIQHGA